MFFEVEMSRNVVISPDKLHTGLLLQRSIILQLLEDVSRVQATEEHGYLVAVTTLESRGEGKIREMTASVVFPVKFKCIVFKPFKNEILEGEVADVMKSGVRVTCGPMTELFLPHQTMKDFDFIPGENPVFIDKQSSKVEKGGKIRFRIIGVKWNEQRRVFQALGSLQGDFLGPIFDAEINRDLDTEVNPDTNAEINHDLDTEVNPDTNAEINPDMVTEINPETNMETNSDMVTEINPETNRETNPDLDTESNPKTNLEINPDLDTEINPVTNMETNPHLDTEVNPKTNPEINPETNHEMNAEKET
uniref:DNA-directed RNA polymerase IV seventh largest subunit n=1 Tax=Ginkgo biloba TaxID=3311 RepID=A0A0C4VYQ8_GINBI|nr:DNA-directed RNA polymerase IV seventh largest subunit [Ginkgo biloba]|eukprot:Gb_14761 [translate_table: standard]